MYQDLLNRVAEEQRRFGSEPQPPCSEAQIQRLSERVIRELAAELPHEYTDFLRLANGLDWNGVVIFASEDIPIIGRPDRFISGLVEINHTYRMDVRFGSLLVLGSNGMDIYACNSATRAYEIYDEAPHNLVERLSSFGEMMRKALSRSLGDV